MNGNLFSLLLENESPPDFMEACARNSISGLFAQPESKSILSFPDNAKVISFAFLWIWLWKIIFDLHSRPDRRDVDAKQQAVAETRNLLLSGSQQLQSCQRYLSNIELPYCGQEEVATLEKAISYIFTDMQSEERHEHALSCYQTTFKRYARVRDYANQKSGPRLFALSTKKRDTHTHKLFWKEEKEENSRPNEWTSLDRINPKKRSLLSKCTVTATFVGIDWLWFCCLTFIICVFSAL